ncbi:MAG: SIMPL domain-containing protein [Minisyncoccia bacterium]
MENNKSLIGFGIILGLSIIISFSIGSYTFYKLRATNFISTTGSATKEYTSDSVKWTSNITRTVTLATVKDGYKKMASDLAAVKSFLSSNGIPDTSIDIAPIFMNEIYDNNSNQANKNYNLTQNITVNSSDVQKIANLSKNTSSLVIDQGILFSTVSLEYYYSKLPDARVALLSDAIADAKARAEKLAEAGGKTIGALQSASSGVVQVLAPNSANTSDYGTYDTSSIEKNIMVTVKTSFEIK